MSEFFQLFASPFETVGFITGILCIWYNTKAHVYGWPLAIISVSSYFVVFFESKLYADMVLQIVYVILNIYGWWNWKKDADNNKIQPRNLPRKNNWILLGLIVIGLTLPIGFLLVKFTDSEVPFFDAITTSLSLVAQVLMGLKFTQNWIIWICADIMYIGLYFFKELYLTALLYLIFTGLAIYGFWSWNKLSNP
jgi:nicotinamide mononucleotide transporter